LGDINRKLLRLRGLLFSRWLISVATQIVAAMIFGMHGGDAHAFCRSRPSFENESAAVQAP
jgi:hypothetical protein